MGTTQRDNKFSTRDMDTLLATGGFAGMSQDQAMDAIAFAVDNPVDDSGRTMPPERFNRGAAAGYLLGELAGHLATRFYDDAVSLAAERKAEHDGEVARAVASVAGVTPNEYGQAVVSKRAGDPSDLLRIYSKFIARC